MDNSDPKNVEFRDYLKPNNWLILLLLLIVRVIAFLPIKVMQSLGRIIGYALYFIPSKRKDIAKRNIELCFPDLNEKEQNKLVKKHFVSLGIGFFEV